MPHRRSWSIAVIGALVSAMVLVVPERTAGWIGVAALLIAAIVLNERARRAGAPGAIIATFALAMTCFAAHTATVVAMATGTISNRVGGPVSVVLSCATIVSFTGAVVSVIGPVVRQQLRIGPVLVSDLIVTYAIAQTWAAVLLLDGHGPGPRTAIPLSIVSLGCAIASAAALMRPGRPASVGLFLAVPAFDLTALVFVVARQLGWQMNAAAVGCVLAASVATWVAFHPRAVAVFRRPPVSGPVHSSWRTATTGIAFAAPCVAVPVMELTGGPSLTYSILGASASIGSLVVFTIIERGGRRHAAEREAIADDLARALRRGTFELHYQPLVHAATAQVTGVEALLRWTAPHHGELGPERTVEIAIEHGLGRTLSSRVITQVIADLPTIRAALGPTSDPYIAINVTTHDLEDDRFARWLEAALGSHDPTGLVLELSEKHPIVDPEAVRRTIDALHTLGVAVALDDFGVGVANAASAGAFDFDYVKLDRSLIVNAAGSLRAERFLQALTDSLRSLDVGVVAEGIEDCDQPSIPRGLDLLQGWAYGAPARLSELRGSTPIARSA